MHLSLLQPIIDRPGPWASVYAEVPHSTEDAAKQRELSADAAARQLAEQGADRATCDAVREALAGFRADGDTAAPAGRAVFATDGEVVLDTPLAGRPAQPFADWSPLPRITPWAEAAADNASCLVVYVDRMGANFELHDDRGGTEAGQVDGMDWPIHRTATADWSERHFQTAVENTWEQNAGEIAEAAQRVFASSGAKVMLLAGDPRERRSVHEKLPEQLRSVTYESDHGGRAAGSDSTALARDIAHVRAAHERDHVADVLDRFRAGAGVGGTDPAYAATGVPALVEAAREHRIDTLIITPGGADAGREVWVGPGADQLAVRNSELQYLGETNPSAARADDALLRSAAANGAEAVVVRDPAEAPTGGLGAVLRWSTPTQHE
ncbi:baeRF2 domain-containing protein [Streptomyces chrestomyceticus]|uniref:baeRF2 domain-containing protein n=1 Tax=Streptomyces chrestomyceticus TaxID=68185 RepID=UPI0019D10B96|nr:Vms1/Ankzf1 family peptidyl-tRNA hydrolase [Streptomyces chrestomyceticus]